MWLSAVRSRWSAPAIAVVLGVLMFGAALLGGQPVVGVSGLLIMTLVALGTAFSGRSETIRALRGDASDERFVLIDLRATAYSGLVLTVAIIGAFIFELALGRNGMPYIWLGVLGGLTYIASILILRVKS